MLAYILSKPDDWEVKVSDLEREGGCGKNRIYRILRELIDAGYVSERQQVQRENGTFSWTPYMVYEEPRMGKTEPCPQKPYTDYPDMENRDILHIREIQSTENNICAVGADDSPTLLPGKECTESAPDNHAALDWKAFTVGIEKTFGVKGGRVNHIANMMLGRSKSKGYQEYNFDVPVTVDELRDFYRWFKGKHDYVIRAPEKIQDHFYRFREERNKREQVIKQFPILTPPDDYAEAVNRWVPKAAGE